MFYLLDLDGLVCRHKHQLSQVVAMLCNIEASDCRCAIVHEDRLHRYKQFDKAQLLQLETSDINLYELINQNNKIQIKDKGFYRYQKGQHSPQKLEFPFINFLKKKPVVDTTPKIKNTALPSWHPLNKS